MSRLDHIAIVSAWILAIYAYDQVVQPVEVWVYLVIVLSLVMFLRWVDNKGDK